MPHPTAFHISDKYYYLFVANDQLDALFLYIYLLYLSTCFEHHSAHHQEIEF